MSGVLNDNKFVCRHQRGLSDCRGEEATEKKSESKRENREMEKHTYQEQDREKIQQREKESVGGQGC